MRRPFVWNMLIVMLLCLAGCNVVSPVPSATAPVASTVTAPARDTPTSTSAPSSTFTPLPAEPSATAPATETATRLAPNTATSSPEPARTSTPAAPVDVSYADVLFVRATQNAGGAWTFDVTVQHADTGWEHYADAWEVLSPADEVLATRVLTHPHVEEQPFTRSMSGIEIPMDLTRVRVRAHDLVHGYGGEEVTVDLSQTGGPGFEVVRPESSRGQLQAMRVSQAPQIDGEPEPAWESAPPLDVPLTWGMGSGEPAFSVELRALYDADRLYLLARWPDAAPDSRPADFNKLTVHWRIEAGAIHCAVACHTAYVTEDLAVRSLNSETIPQGGGEVLPAAGGWNDGEWIVEWSRPLKMANAYDLQFVDLHTAYPFLVKVFESIPERPDPVSAMAELVFQ